MAQHKQRLYGWCKPLKRPRMNHERFKELLTNMTVAERWLALRWIALHYRRWLNAQQGQN